MSRLHVMKRFRILVEKKYFIVISFCFVGFFQAYSDVKPAALFCDYMVLQRAVEIPVWGKAWPSESVTVSFNGETVTVKADLQGNWMVKLSKRNAGGPYQLQIAGDNVLVYKDVYVGDVWLCSGQSNMDMTVAKEDRYWCGVTNEAEEVANSNYPLIRFFDVDFTPSHILKPDVTGKWEVCSPKTVGHQSAVAYFFARQIYQKYKIPLGMLISERIIGKYFHHEKNYFLFNCNKYT